MKPVEILLVEDNPADVRLAREALKEINSPHHLSVVYDGEQAIDFLFHHELFPSAPLPDLILLDLNIPKKSGSEVLAEVKKNDLTRCIPVIIYSSSRAAADVTKAYELQANCFITKPSNLDDIYEVIRSIDWFWLSTARLPRHNVAS